MEPSDWITPSFVKIKEKKSKRISPYLETEIWDKDELQTIIKYEQFKRNKAALALLWDLDARPHEIASLENKTYKIKRKIWRRRNTSSKQKQEQVQFFLTFSFPYVRDWLNEHPFKNELNARLICNLKTGAPIRADQI